MMRQYQEIKAKYPDAILFFRLGDFYEMFFEDALEASRLLQITLTARNKGENKAPMCGVPYHAANSYIAKLTKLGRKVAICEQLTDPNGTGIVERDVVRVITPGTTLDDSLLDQKSNNYLLALVEKEGVFGLAYTDVSTGELKTVEITDAKDVLTELERIHPSEAIVPSDFFKREIFAKLSKAHVGTFFFAHDFFAEPTQFLQDHFGVQDLEGFGIGSMKAGLLASALLLDYLKTTQKTALHHLQKVQPYSLSEFMPLDEATLKNLEILTTLRENKKEGSLLWVLDHTVTSMGGRFLRFVLTHPLLDKAKIEERLDAVDELFSHPSILEDAREVLKTILDLERLLGRLSLGYGNARDLLALKNSLQAVPYLQSILAALSAELFSKILGQTDALPDIVTLIENAVVDEPPLAIKEGGMIKDGFHGELDDLKKISRDGKTIIQSMQQKEIERTGINSLKIRYNNIFGYYIEVSKTHLDAIPSDYIRKQTLVNAERYITPELKEYEEKVLGAEEKMVALEYQIFSELRGRVVKEIPRIQKLAQAIAQFDLIGCFAKVALESRYYKPIIREDSVLKIEKGRHPVVEKMSFASQFVPNDLSLSADGQRVLLITGPNMGGKSTYLRQVALITLLAHLGSFVPAAHAEISVVDRIFTRVGASDNLVRGQSTFMVEMQETAFILQNATAKSLVILDEIGRGTSTYDGMSLAWAILEFLHDKIGAKTLFASHYHELIALAEKLPHAANYCVAVKENAQEGVVFLYKIVEGGVDRSYGIEVAKLAGLPAEVTSKARQILVDLEEGVMEEGIQNQLTDSRKRVAKDQLQLFERTVGSLKNLDVNSLTPIEALNTLASMKEKLS